MGQLMDWYNQNQSALAQQQMNAVVYGSGVIGGAIGNQYAIQNQQFYNPYQNTSTAASASGFSFGAYDAAMKMLEEKAVVPVKKAWKKTNNFLVDLRHEIDTWHGDVLMRAA